MHPGEIEDMLLHSEAESEGTCNCCHGAECPTHDFPQLVQGTPPDNRRPFRCRVILHYGNGRLAKETMAGEVLAINAIAAYYQWEGKFRFGPANIEVMGIEVYPVDGKGKPLGFDT